MKYTIEKISNSNFFEFGDFINPYDKKAEDINTNTTKSYFDLANIEILGEDNKARLNLFDAKKREFPLVIDMLEQHPFSSQVFLPLGNNPFFVIVCPAAIKPDLNNLKIFKSLPDRLIGETKNKIENFYLKLLYFFLNLVDSDFLKKLHLLN